MNLRRVLTALAVLAVFTAVAGAQIVQPTPISCSVQAVATPTIRAEGINERVGDIWIVCTGGPQPSNDNLVDRTAITVNYGVPVTSQTDSAATPKTSSEAVLSIDEPYSIPNSASSIPIAGFGQNAPIGVCTADSTVGNTASPLTGCTTYAEQVTTAGASCATAGCGYWVLSSAKAAGPPVAAVNVYQGVNGTAANSVNQISFSNVPVLAPYTTSVSRIYRITNVRVNPGSATTITATVTITPGTPAITALSLTNSTAVVANVASSLTTSVAPLSGVSLCAATGLQPGVGQLKANASILTFKENFAGAFKTQALPLTLAETALDAETPANALANQVAITGNYGPLNQGAANGTKNTYSSYNSESMWVKNIGAISAGLATNGTRLKAVFANVPSNVTLYVSLNNVTDYQTIVTTPTNPGDALATPYAVLQSGKETATPYGAATAFGTTANSVVNVAAVAISKGAGQATWEITNSVPGSIETLNFAVYAVYSTTAPPASGNSATVTLGYAPTTNATTPIANIPQWVAPSAAATAFLNILPCQTTLLFPFVSTTKVTATQHWETGIAISNTGGDPWNSVPVPTTPSTTTTCTLTFFGGGVATGSSSFTPPQVTGPAIGPGQNWAFVASDPLQAGNAPNAGFAGYMFAVCNFQFAHGFAFIEDNSPTGNAMGYLALVVDNRSAIQRAASLTGEDLAH